MVRLGLVLLATLILISLPAAADPGAEPKPDQESTDPLVVYSPAYVDVLPGAPFEDEIRRLHTSGITRGCQDDGRAYCPDRPVTRGEMAAFLGRAMELDGIPVEGAARFVDTLGSVFLADIGRLAESGVTRGCNPPTNDRFCPTSPVTRGQMAAFLVRALQLEDRGTVEFVDDDGMVFEADIARLAAAGVTRGCNPPANDRFCPERLVTRGEMAAFLARGFALADVPVAPTHVTVERFGHPTAPVGVALTLCQPEEATGGVAVRNAAHIPGFSLDASRYPPSSNHFSAGTYDTYTDVWTTPPGPGCFEFEIGWDPRANDIQPPLTTLEITSHFGRRFHPIHRAWRLHAGTDFRAYTGEPVYAAAPGAVVAATRHPAYGRMVDVQHVGGLLTRYAHLSSIGVSVGDAVKAGQVLGRAGCTGTCTGPHLHFETREFGEAVDPMTYLR